MKKLGLVYGSLASASKTCCALVQLMLSITTRSTSTATDRVRLNFARRNAMASRTRLAQQRSRRLASNTSSTVTLFVGVNAKNKDDVTHAGCTPGRPSAIYIVPVLPRFGTQQQFWDEHISYYKNKQSSGLPLVDGRRTVAPDDGRRFAGPDDGRRFRRMGLGQGHRTRPIAQDDGWRTNASNDVHLLNGMIECVIRLHELRHTFECASSYRMSKMLTHYATVPEVASKLERLGLRQAMGHNKFKRIRPMFFWLVGDSP